MSNYANLLSRVVGVPLLIEQDKADAILAVLGERAGFEVLPSAKEAREAEAMAAAERQNMLDSAAREAGVRVERTDAGYTLAGGVAVVPIMGSLVQRRTGMDAMSGMQSYGSLQAMLSDAADNPRVHTILLEVDSPGGEVAGVFDLADYMESLRDKKRLVAHANERAASAAYLLAATAGEVYLSRTARAGSIGVVTSHVDRSGQLAKQGVVVTHIYAGEHKVDGSPTGPLSPAIKANIQAEIDDTYALFTSTVDRLRKTQVGAARATKAAILTGKAAVDAGLADGVEPFNATFSRLVREQGRRPEASTKETKQMSAEQIPNPQAAAPTAPTATSEAVVPVTAVAADPKLTERARMSAILGHAEAAGRDELAKHLAFNTDMSAEAAAAVLAVSPKVAAPAAPAANTDTGLDRAMRAAGTPGIINEAEVANLGSPKAADPWAAAVKTLGGK